MLKKLASAIILCATITFVHAQAVRKYSNEFLAIGVGARALGSPAIAPIRLHF